MNEIENNKLIAEFIWGEPEDEVWYRNKDVISLITLSKGSHHIEQLCFDTSWDWLMPCVEKISDYKYEDGETAYPRTFGMPFNDGLIDSETTVMVRFNRQQVFHGKTLIEVTYQAVIDFIKWYNTTKN